MIFKRIQITSQQSLRWWFVYFVLNHGSHCLIYKSDYYHFLSNKMLHTCFLIFMLCMMAEQAFNKNMRVYEFFQTGKGKCYDKTQRNPVQVIGKSFIIFASFSISRLLSPLFTSTYSASCMAGCSYSFTYTKMIWTQNEKWLVGLSN